jgi:hypothetical protein
MFPPNRSVLCAQLRPFERLRPATQTPTGNPTQERLGCLSLSEQNETDDPCNPAPLYEFRTSLASFAAFQGEDLAGWG